MQRALIFAENWILHYFLSANLPKTANPQLVPAVCPPVRGAIYRIN